MVEVHGPHPHADAGAGLGDLGDGLWRELLHGHVWLDLLDDRVRYVVLLKGEEAVEELVGIGEQLLAGLPVIGNLLACSATATLSANQLLCRLVRPVAAAREVTCAEQTAYTSW